MTAEPSATPPPTTTHPGADPAASATPFVPAIPPADPPPAPPVAVPAGPAPVAASGKAGRLSPGELRRQVAAFLDTHPGEHTPGEIARGLGDRSSGAVGNALEALAASGAAKQTTDRPRRFTATAATAGAAVGAAPPRPAAPRPRPSKPAPPAAPAVPAPPVAPATATPSTPAPVPVPDPPLPPGAVRRPGGGVYRSRELAGLPDVEALRKLRAAGVPVLLYGPPGTGKTSLVEAAYPDLITVAGDGDTTVADFVGEYTQDPGGGYTFVYGPLIRAMLEGRCLFIDDATLISPAVLAVVYPAMDGRGEIVVKAHKGETITAAPGFYVIGGHNPGVHGAVLTDALSSRFGAQIEVSADYDIAHDLGISPRAVNAARNLAKRRTSGEIGWAPMLRELIAFQRVADALGERVAAANLLGVAPAEDRDIVATVIKTVFGAELAPLALGTRIGPKR